MEPREDDLGADALSRGPRSRPATAARSGLGASRPWPWPRRRPHSAGRPVKRSTRGLTGPRRRAPGREPRRVRSGSPGTLFAERMASLIIGDRSAASTDIGPLATETGRRYIEALVDDAGSKGATSLTGGRRLTSSAAGSTSRPSRIFRTASGSSQRKHSDLSPPCARSILWKRRSRSRTTAAWRCESPCARCGRARTAPASRASVRLGSSAYRICTPVSTHAPMPDYGPSR